MQIPRLASIFLGLLVMQTAYAKNGPPQDKKGRTENATAIITVLTDPGTGAGLFSDQNTNSRYFATALAGQDDPDNAGEVLGDGDCVAIITPAADGVDQGKLVFFAPILPSTCPDPGQVRQLEVLGTGYDLNGDAVIEAELVDVRFGCNDVFPQNSPIPGLTTTSCGLEVRQYDASDEFERTWIIEWSEVHVTHLEADLRQIDAVSYADIFELVAPSRGKGKKDKVRVTPDAGFPLPFSMQIRRVSAP